MPGLISAFFFSFPLLPLMIQLFFLFFYWALSRRHVFLRTDMYPRYMNFSFFITIVMGLTTKFGNGLCIAFLFCLFQLAEKARLFFLCTVIKLRLMNSVR